MQMKLKSNVYMYVFVYVQGVSKVLERFSNGCGMSWVHATPFNFFLLVCYGLYQFIVAYLRFQVPSILIGGI